MGAVALAVEECLHCLVYALRDHGDEDLFEVDVDDHSRVAPR